MRAAIHQFISPNVDLERFSPSDPSDAGVLVQMLIGSADREGAESFYVFVCTPRYLTHWHGGDGPIIGRHILIVQAWHWPAIRDFLAHVVESEEAGTWEELTKRLGRLGRWEFEDFSPPWWPHEKFG